MRLSSSALSTDIGEMPESISDHMRRFWYRSAPPNRCEVITPSCDALEDNSRPRDASGVSVRILKIMNNNACCRNTLRYLGTLIMIDY
jgi:hypothetical protein